MKAVGYYKPGGPEVLTTVDIPTVDAGVGEVRVRVHAAAVNPADTLMRAGDVDVSWLPPPHVPGMDIAGVIDQVGADAETRFASGDAVMALVVPTRPHGGGYAEYVVVPVDWVVKAPPNITLVEAATIPMNGLTALWAIHVLGLTAGSSAAVTGTAGAFGSYFLQLCIREGIRVIADSSESDEPFIRSLGADLIARRGNGYAADVRKQLPAGVDAMADGALLGASALEAIADQGVYSSLRAIGERGTAALPAPAPRGIVYRHFNFFENPDIRGSLMALANAVEEGQLTPRVGEVISPIDVGRAHAALEKGGVRGRFVIDFM
jgi:NADPH:quinone reductase